MALYSPVDRRIWTDRKFRAYSDGAKLLWFFLLTCPETNSLPGVLVIGKASICEALKWLPEPFGERFGELFQGGSVEADFDARLIWLKNGLRYRPPANPNVVMGWSDSWDQVPECELKITVENSFSAYFQARGGSFDEAWKRLPSRSLNGMPNRSPNGSGNGMPYQEQDQDQEKEQERSVGKRPSKRSHSASSDQISFRAHEVQFTASKAFNRAGYSGHDGAIFWQLSALALCGKISEHEFNDVLEATRVCGKNKPGYIRICFRELLTKRSPPVDADTLLTSVKIVDCPKSAPKLDL